MTIVWQIRVEMFWLGILYATETGVAFHKAQKVADLKRLAFLIWLTSLRFSYAGFSPSATETKRLSLYALHR